MKNFTLFIAALFVSAVSFGQSQRIVLLEHFTQASCGPCAASNPILQSKIDDNANKIVSIKYQVSWPGVDPMNAHNPGQVSARTSYYTVSGVPTSVVDGNYYKGSPGGVSVSMINTRYAAPAGLTINSERTINSTQDSIFVRTVVRASQAVNGASIKAHVVVVEKEINFTSPPGSNGEKEFRNVMKRMLPSQTGTLLPSAMVAGDSVVIETSWKLANVYSNSNLEVVSFVQDDANKAVLNAHYTAMPTPQFALDAEAKLITNPSKTYCGSQLAPAVTIRNNGAAPLQTLQINYAVNGGTMNTFNWFGNLNFYETETVILPSFVYTNAFANNDLVVTLSNPNGGTDLNAANDQVNVLFDAKIGSPNLTLLIKPDNYGSETTWNLKNSSGQTLFSGGPYVDGNTNLITVPMAVNTSECFNFNIFDGYGDGICCAWGSGYYRILDHTGQILVSGGTFGSSERANFEVDMVLGVNDVKGSNEMIVYPNPFTNEANISFAMSSAQEVNVKVYNSLGKLVYSAENGVMSAGSHMLTFNSTDLAAGIYFVNLQTGSSFQKQKVTLTR